MDSTALKIKAARAALSYIEPDSVIGIGSGSTVNALIEAMAQENISITATVASSEATATRLRQSGFSVIDLNEVHHLDLYIDGADEVDGHGRMIKGGGGALTREKIVAAASRRFLCIADSSKRVEQLGTFPLAIEILPMAREQIIRNCAHLGGVARLRTGFLSDNGLPILDVSGLDFSDPSSLESTLNQWPGVVCHGLFVRQSADMILLASADRLDILEAERLACDS